MSNNAHDLSNRLLNALDNNYNVVDMQAVNEIISVLEKFNITKELLETTRLGKHVNELRRKTNDPMLARRAKVLVKRWRDLVIPTVASPAHTGSNRASAERSLRRLGGTPLTSPALSRQVVSPAVPSPKHSSRPAWGGYESDSQDVILVDDDPPPPPPPPPAAPPSLAPSLAPAAHKTHTPSLKRPLSPDILQDDKKSKKDKKPKKRRGHSRAGEGTDAAEGGKTGGSWGARNGTHVERRRNGCKRGSLDPYSALVNRIPQAGVKKVKTTKELLEEIQSRGTKPPSSPAPGSPSSPDVMLIEPEPCPVSVESPLRNGEARSPSPPLEDERPYVECTCDDAPDDSCPAARRRHVRPVDVRALHCALLPGVNGTRAPLHPHQFAVRPLVDTDRPGLFNSVVPLYKYSDYADDRVVKNMDRVPLCRHLPWTQFAPEPNESLDEEANERLKIPPVEDEVNERLEDEVSERLKPPLATIEEETLIDGIEQDESEPMDVVEEFERDPPAHRTVERTKEQLDGKTLYSVCEKVIRSIPYDYSQTSVAPVVTLPTDESETEKVLERALADTEDCERDEMGRPPAPERFAEWHECVKVGQLVVLPYVVID